MKLFKSQPKMIYSKTYFVTQSPTRRETLFTECPNLSKEYLQNTIVDKRPLFDWYAEHLAKRYKQAEIRNDEATLELLYSEIKRLDLCNTLLLYDYMSDEEDRPCI